MRTFILSVLALLALSAPAVAQEPQYLLWQYDESDGSAPGELNLLYVLRHSPDVPFFTAEDYILAEFAYAFLDGADEVISTSGEWYNDAGACKFQFTTIANQQGGGRVVGASDTLEGFAAWAIGLPDRYPPPVTISSVRLKKKK
jgi:hypothetical protein